MVAKGQMNELIGSVQPVRGAVQLNGQIIGGWTSLEVDNSLTASKDTFEVSFAVNALPAGQGVEWLSEQKDAYVQIYAGVPPNPMQWSPSDLPQWMYGQVDRIKFSPRKGIVKLSGGDLSRVFIEAKVTEKYQNKTSSQIATYLAQKHGFASQVVPTTIPAGKYYQIDNDAMSNARTEWDVLTYLARIEQFVVYVRGKTLYFQPRPDPSTATPYQIVWTPPDAQTGYPSGNVLDINFERSLTVSRGVQVVVRSFNDVEGVRFVATFPASGKSSGTPGSVGTSGDSQTYVYNVDNLTQQKCDQYARAKYHEIIQHEMTLQAEMPAAGNDALDVTSIIEVSGTGTAYDQIYYPESITRSLSFTDGYKLELHAKNNAPDSQQDAGGDE